VWYVVAGVLCICDCRLRGSPFVVHRCMVGAVCTEPLSSRSLVARQLLLGHKLTLQAGEFVSSVLRRW
jgi:hypothetical protein